MRMGKAGRERLERDREKEREKLGVVLFILRELAREGQNLPAS